MLYLRQHIQSIISSYNGSLPLTHYLRNYYKQYPKLGSRDRKMLTELAYSWYRCSKGLPEELSFEEQLVACLKLCNTTNERLLQLAIQWAGNNADINCNSQLLFAYDVALSNGITKEEWSNSMLIQPDLFIRIRKNKKKVEQLLAEAGITYNYISEHCMALPNGAAIDKVLPEYLYVVQDASSQETGRYFNPEPNEEWWDCCSGAGGKSLLLCDKEPLINLTVSDMRSTILHNLKERFRMYSMIIPKTHVIDMSNAKEVNAILKGSMFDNILCDVPCTGSGTWARTPEQIYYFDVAEIERIATLQRQIVINALQHLKPGGRLFYITCSVFQQENETVAQYITEHTNLHIEQQELINGTEKRADSMFIAVLKKPTA